MTKKSASLSISKTSPLIEIESLSFNLTNDSLQLKSFLNQTAKSLALDVMEVWLCISDNTQITRAVHSGRLKTLWVSRHFPIMGSALGQVVQSGKDLILNLSNQSNDQVHPSAFKAGIQSIACLPIKNDVGAILGVLCAAAKHPESLEGGNLKSLHLISTALASIVELKMASTQLERTSVLEERERIGMDLHDGIIQSLYAIGLNLQNMRSNLNDERGDSIKRLDQSIQSLNEVIRNIRAYILDLRPRGLQKDDLLQSMHALIRELRANTQIELDLQDETGGLQDLPQDYAKALFHIFQEALANVARHAKAHQVTVRLWRVNERVMLHVSDDGVGFNPSRTDQHIGHGLSNMQLRAQSVNGGVEVITIRRQGTTILAWVPMK